MSGKTNTVFETPWFQIATIDPGNETSGTTDPYYCIVRPAGVVGLVFDETGRIILVEQYRPPLERETLEMPAGTVEADETRPQAMAREILEETGYACETLIPIGPCRLMLNRENVIEYFFIGLKARPVASYRRKERGIVRLLERDTFLGLVLSDQFEQTVVLGAMYVAERRFGVDLCKDDIKAIEAQLIRRS